MNHLRWSAFTFLLIVLATMAPARGDGGFFVTREHIGKAGAAASAKQEAVLITDGQRVQVILRTHFRAGPADLAWVVPVPAEPDDISVGSDAVFTKLDEQTAPQFYQEHYYSKGWSCGCSAGDGGSVHFPVTPNVHVVKSGEAGIYDYVVLKADDGASLMEWLNKNQYAVPASAGKIFEHYAAMRWHWLAMRVRPNLADVAGERSGGTHAPKPITYSYKADRLVFPLVISQVSAYADNEIVLHVVAKERYGCTNWTNAVVNTMDIARDPASPSGTDYERRFAAARTAGDGRVFITEHALSWGDSLDGPRQEAMAAVSPALLKSIGPSMCVTRLRAVVAPAAMDRDVELAAWGGAGDSSKDWVNNHIRVSGVVMQTSSSGAMFPVVLAAGALACGFIGRSRRPWRGTSALVAGVLLCMI